MSPNPRSNRFCRLPMLAALIATFSACWQWQGGWKYPVIDFSQVDSIELIQVVHPYLGGVVDRKKLEKVHWEAFLRDFADKREEDFKFYSCYVIMIHIKGHPLISYRTNGQIFEVFRDSTTNAKYFKLNRDINLVTKYWGIPEDHFCDSAGINVSAH